MAILKIKDENGKFIDIPSIKGEKGEDGIDGGVTDYNDLTNKPELFSGSYNDLTDKPELFSGSYDDLSNKPNLFSGSYEDLTDKPNLFSGSYNDLTDKPELFSGDYEDLANKPTIPDVNDMGSIVVDDIKCKNIFNVYDFKNDTAEIMVSTNEITLSSSKAFAEGYIDIYNLKPDTQYTFNANFEQLGDLTTIRVSPRYLENSSVEVKAVNSTLQSGTISTTFTTSSSGNIRIYIYSNFTNTAISTQLKVYNIQLEKGTVATSYVSYRRYGYNDVESMGDIIVDDIKCKNLFNKNLYSLNYLANNDISTNTLYYGAKIHLGEPNTDYYLQTEYINKYTSVGVSNMYVLMYPAKNRDWLAIGHTGLGITNGILTTDENGDVIIQVYKTLSKTDYENLMANSNIIITKGSTPTTYTPYRAYGIVESGTNENGTWVKYDDGRMECYGITEITSDSSGNYEEQIYATFPAAFVGNYKKIVVLATTNFSDPSTASVLPVPYAASVESLTNFWLVPLATSYNSTTSYSVCWEAKGRWK